MKMKMIVAMAKNGGIGFKNKIPWKLGADLNYFKEKTIGNGNNAIVMGKNTWLSLPHSSKYGKFLPKRDNIILSKKSEIKYVNNGPTVPTQYCFLSSIDEMKKYCKERNYEEVWIIGGETIYKQMISDTDLDEIYVTEVDKIYEKTYEVDAYFPTISDNFSLLAYSQPLRDNNISYEHKIYKRQQHSPTEKWSFNPFPRYSGILSPFSPTKFL